MKIRAVTGILALLLSQYSAAGNWYGDLTYTDSQGGLPNPPYATDVDNSDSGWQITSGYDVNDHFALEFGFVDYGKQSQRTPIFTIAGVSPSPSTLPNVPLVPFSTRVVGIAAIPLSNGQFPRQGIVTETKGLRFASIGKLPLNASFDLNFQAGALIPRYKTTEEFLVPDFAAASGSTPNFIPSRIDSHTEVSNEPEIFVGLGVHWRMNPAIGVKLFWEKINNLGNEDTFEQDIDTYNLALRYQF